MSQDKILFLPVKLRDLDVTFPTGVDRLLPSWDSIPMEFKRGQSSWCRLVGSWLFKGLDAKEIRERPGIDRNDALRHLKACMGSFEPKHEHKIAGVAYLMSLWFEEVRE